MFRTSVCELQSEQFYRFHWNTRVQNWNSSRKSALGRKGTDSYTSDYWQKAFPHRPVSTVGDGLDAPLRHCKVNMAWRATLAVG